MARRVVASAFVVLLVAAAVLSPVAGLVSDPARQNADQTEESVDAGAGEQLSTVLHAESEAVHSEVRTQLFATQFASVSGSEAATLVNARIDSEYRRASRISAAYDRIADDRTPGRLRRYVALTVRAKALERRLTALEERLTAAPASKLDPDAVRTDRIESARELLEPLTGPGTRDLVDRFQGRTARNVSIGFDDGVRITVTARDGSEIRTTRRRADGRRTVEISEQDARETALAALADEPGTWTVESTTLRSRFGLFRVELTQESGASAAVATVDASSNTVVRLVVRSAEENDSELVLRVRRGELAPGETAIVRVVQPPTGAVEGAVITADGVELGTTGRLGGTRITIPEDATALVVTADDQTKRISLEE